MPRLSTYSTTPPSSSILEGELRHPDYVDSFGATLTLANDISVDYLWASVFTDIPAWVDCLMRLRDHLVGVFGLRSSGPRSVTVASQNIHYAPGDRAVIFTVIQRTDNELVLGKTDRHLDFRVSLWMVRGKSGPSEIRATTVVFFNNLWGRLYFLPVRPFHRLIVRRLVNRLVTGTMPWHFTGTHG